MRPRTSTWTPSGATYSYQWYAGGAAIPRATNPTFTPRAEQLGKQLRVKVTATKAGTQTGTALSMATAATAPGVLAVTAPPTIAGKLRSAINNSGLKITAADNGALVTLTNQRNTSLGNQAITESVGDSDFIVNGMSNGAGGDCAAGIGCLTGADCQSGVCKSDKTCQ